MPPERILLGWFPARNEQCQSINCKDSKINRDDVELLVAAFRLAQHELQLLGLTRSYWPSRRRGREEIRLAQRAQVRISIDEVARSVTMVVGLTATVRVGDPDRQKDRSRIRQAGRDRRFEKREARRSAAPL